MVAAVMASHRCCALRRVVGYDVAEADARNEKNHLDGGAAADAPVLGGGVGEGGGGICNRAGRSGAVV